MNAHCKCLSLESREEKNCEPEINGKVSQPLIVLKNSKFCTQSGNSYVSLFCWCAHFAHFHSRWEPSIQNSSTHSLSIGPLRISNVCHTCRNQWRNVFHMMKIGAWRFILCELWKRGGYTFIYIVSYGWQQPSGKLFGMDFMWKLHVCWLNQKHGINLALVNSVKVKQRTTQWLIQLREALNVTWEICATDREHKRHTHINSKLQQSTTTVNSKRGKVFDIENPTEFNQLNFQFSFNSNLECVFSLAQP